ncbi:MAG: c-type cytochrome [Steroidobacteraceae bacterium]
MADRDLAGRRGRADAAFTSLHRLQVAAGRLAYARACGICHGATLEGAAAVALSGNAFARTWGDGRHRGADFFDAIAKQMPKNAPGSLSEADNLAIAAFILGSNGYEAGAVSLTLAALSGALPESTPTPLGTPGNGHDLSAGTADSVARKQPGFGRRTVAARTGCGLADLQPHAGRRSLLAAHADQCRQRTPSSGQMHRAAG